jgi:formiminotetrahydrofolate cyclodeaminase
LPSPRLKTLRDFAPSRGPRFPTRRFFPRSNLSVTMCPMYDQNVSIKSFLDAASARQPTPGGGAVTAMTGALAVSMGEMVLNYSIGKKGLEAYSQQLSEALREMHNARNLLMQLMVEDQHAFAALTAARKLPESDPERRDKFNVALLACVRVPEAIGATSIAVLETCDRIVHLVNYHLLSDLAVCADLAMATARCAVYNVKVNLSDVTDPEDRVRIEQVVGQLLSHAGLLIQRVSPRIWARHASGK